MSRGPGKLERAIVAIFSDEPEAALTTEEVCLRIYGEPVEKKHRVAVVRAARKVVSRHPEIGEMEGENLGGQLVFYRGDVVLSYALARLKSDNLYDYRNNDPRRDDPYRRWQPDEKALLARLREGGRDHHCVIPGGPWWDHTQQFIMRMKGEADSDEYKQIEAKRDAELAVLADRINAGFNRSPLSVSQPKQGDGQETLNSLASQLRDLASQNDPDVVREGIIAVADQLDGKVTTDI